MKFPQQHINQSKTWICGVQTSVELYDFINPFCSSGFKFLEISCKMLCNINLFVSDFVISLWSADWILDDVSKNEGISVENDDSISTTAITFVVFIAKITDRFAKKAFVT